MTVETQNRTKKSTECPFDRHGPIDEPDEPFDINAVIRKYQSRTPEEIEDIRRRLYALTPEPRPLPPGKTIDDVVRGLWPGNETDEEIDRALEDIS